MRSNHFEVFFFSHMVHTLGKMPPEHIHHPNQPRSMNKKSEMWQMLHFAIAVNNLSRLSSAYRKQTSRRYISLVCVCVRALVLVLVPLCERAVANTSARQSLAVRCFSFSVIKFKLGKFSIPAPMFPCILNSTYPFYLPLQTISQWNNVLK